MSALGSVSPGALGSLNPGASGSPTTADCPSLSQAVTSRGPPWGSFSSCCRQLSAWFCSSVPSSARCRCSHGQGWEGTVRLDCGQGGMQGIGGHRPRQEQALPAGASQSLAQQARPQLGPGHASRGAVSSASCGGFTVGIFQPFWPSWQDLGILEKAGPGGKNALAPRGNSQLARSASLLLGPLRAWEYPGMCCLEACRRPHECCPVLPTCQDQAHSPRPWDVVCPGLSVALHCYQGHSQRAPRGEGGPPCEPLRLRGPGKATSCVHPQHWTCWGPELSSVGEAPLVMLAPTLERWVQSLVVCFCV